MGAVAVKEVPGGDEVSSHAELADPHAQGPKGLVMPPAAADAAVVAKHEGKRFAGVGGEFRVEVGGDLSESGVAADAAGVDRDAGEAGLGEAEVWVAGLGYCAVEVGGSEDVGFEDLYPEGVV